MSDYAINYVETRNNNMTVEVNGFLLHSKYDPIKEAQRIAEKEYDPQGLCILFGYGLGYLAQEILNLSIYNDNLLIIDPLYEKIDHQLTIDLTVMSEKNDREWARLIHSKLLNYSKKIKVICAPNYEKICAEEYSNILKQVKNIQSTNQVLENTTRNFSEMWEKNYVYNLLELKNTRNFDSLTDSYSCPIIIASGGPSLIKQLPLVKEIRSKILLVAAGSTINTLLKYDIIPDYIVSIDGGEINYEHFKNISDLPTTLISSFSNHYKIQQQWKNDKYVFLDGGDAEFQSYVERTFGVTVPLLYGGASVANYAFSCAIKMTTGPIALIGQDLAYTDFKTHAEANENYKIVDEQYMKARGMYYTDGYYEDQVLTDDAFLLMKNDFERLYQEQSQGRTIFNCTEGGIKIDGIPQISFHSFCYDVIQEQQEILCATKVQKYHLNKALYEQKLKDEILFMEQSIKQIKIARIALTKNSAAPQFDKKVLKELDKADQLVVKVKEKTIINRILDPLILDIMTKFIAKPNEKPEEKYVRIFTQNEYMYRMLEENITTSKTYLEYIMGEL